MLASELVYKSTPFSFRKNSKKSWLMHGNMVISFSFIKNYKSSNIFIIFFQCQILIKNLLRNEPKTNCHLHLSPQTHVGHSCPGGISMRQLESEHSGVGQPSGEGNIYI